MLLRKEKKTSFLIEKQQPSMDKPECIGLF